MALVKFLEELREFNPDTGHVDRRGGVLDPRIVVDGTDPALFRDAVDDPDVRIDARLERVGERLENLVGAVFGRHDDRTVTTVGAAGEDVEGDLALSRQWRARNEQVRPGLDVGVREDICEVIHAKYSHPYSRSGIRWLLRRVI